MKATNDIYKPINLKYDNYIDDQDEKATITHRN